MPRLLTILVGCSLLLTFAACKNTDDPVVPETPGFDTPDHLVAAFVARYEGQDVAAYCGDLLAPEYRFILRPQTVIEFELPREAFTRDDEAAIATAMFRQEANSRGEVLSTIEFVEFMPQGQWQPVAAEDPYFGDVAGAVVRTYAVTLFVNVVGDQRYEISGSQLIYVTGDSQHLLGQLDLTGDGKGVEAASWSDV